MSKEYISVIIPVFNCEKFIEKCVESLFGQTYDNIEYIFINDKTRDNSIEILESIIEKYPKRRKNVKIIHHKYNQGSAASRNTGLINATGEYIIFCDSDDWVDTDLYTKMYTCAIENNADIVCCDFALVYKTKTIYNKYTTTEEDITNLYDLKFDLLYSSVCNKLVKKDLYTTNNINFFPNIDMWEDLGVMSRLRYYSKKTIILNNLYYYYNKENSTSIVSIPNESKIQQQIKCAELLYDFFKDKGSAFDNVVKYLKFMSKSDYLFNVHTRNIEKWRNIYPDTHKFIFTFHNLPFNMRVISWLVSLKMNWIALFILKLKASIK
ncbi:glycosyltransferase family 2 protein [Elizabethkingia meningoseptica]|uniref:glycosyltransferase family 2 protein n=1 Tax=Elizabethkingia meningoseptica TaxID=238 RepID=UPI000841A879|nr:glycosyltransferase family 2 protein [Elizabethkingia meningoseptica]ODM54980.1 hypothetical protein BES09_00515 [Elizabethkingia meningoseptica]OHT30186.1 hypothetical protein BFF93_00520 [Elizabethkingia meningoseptica]OPC11859.1 hypothetical protein BAX93_04975 [Elizabethkingia meningoseptica]